MKRYVLLLICVLVTLILPGSLSAQTTSLTSTFTYQGHLNGANGAVSGTCDFQFGLFNAITTGTQVGSTITSTAITINNGTFSVPLDFGATAFDGTDRYLEIAVRCPAGSGNYTTLTPRQTVTAAPYALGLYGLEVQHNVSSPNLIGGYSGNNVAAGVVGATIGGGGESGFFNNVTDNYGTVSGGRNNQAGSNNVDLTDAFYATIGGGLDNIASDQATTVSGGQSNTAVLDNATVSGGFDNTAGGFSATVGGGFQNTASGDYAIIDGGRGNTASTSYATIGGGLMNSVTVNFGVIAGGGPIANTNVNLTNNRVLDDYGVIGGGSNNRAGNGTGTLVDAFYATISGGQSNNATDEGSTVGGGFSNTASNNVATVGGGSSNTASGNSATVGGGYTNTASGSYTTVGGGQQNIASAIYATVSGGFSNTASADNATVGGGESNTASDMFATVGGGWANIASGSRSTVGGGYQNIASGNLATVPGGFANVALGEASFAAGRQAKANHDGAFVWADDSALDFASTGANQFLARAVGGFYFYTNTALTNGCTLPPGGGAWSCTSDRSVKENIAPVDPQAILQNVVSMPIATWNYIAQGDEIRHIGPMAQDFYGAFGVGENDTHITTIDADGVALAAIQGLNQLVEDQRTEIDALQAENSALKSRLDDIESRLGAVESASQPISESSLAIPALIFGVLALVWKRKGRE